MTNTNTTNRYDELVATAASIAKQATKIAQDAHIAAVAAADAARAALKTGDKEQIAVTHFVAEGTKLQAKNAEDAARAARRFAVHDAEGMFPHQILWRAAAVAENAAATARHAGGVLKIYSEFEEKAKAFHAEVSELRSRLNSRIK